ncbi:MAG: transcriptional regulator [Planctomycetaceae bacterium]|nr:transcriptional regulator [Planctomycetaceae bacterium]|tara:strand:- start:2221 stop:3420 length:1200 start_codon:yes stop_codon:yes gene_type:complete
MTTASNTDITVPLLDLKAQYDTIRDEIEPVVRDVIESQWFIGGPKLAELEADISKYCSCTHAVGCASGSDAILLPLQGLEIGHGDLVVCPSYTFFSTAGSIHRLGATPVFCDVDPASYNMTPETLQRAFDRPDSDRIKAIIPVHLFGQCCDMDGILEFAAARNVPVIEDAAQAIGAEDLHGRRAGSMGIAGCFSFFPSKNLGGFGDAGIVTTQDEALGNRLAKLRNHGMDPKYYHDEIGLNSRLDALQAAVLTVKLRHLDSWTEGRQKNAAFYDAAIRDAGGASSKVGLEVASDLPLRFPEPAGAGARHIYNQYIVRVPAKVRDLVRTRLSEMNVGSEIYYPLPLHLQKCFDFCGGSEGDHPAAEAAAHESIAIPIYPDLTETQRAHVIQSLIAIVRAL